MNVKPQHIKRFWNKKNILFISLFLILAISVGATFAYLTGYNGQKTYTFKGAYVDCQVMETFATGDITKSNVKIKNSGNARAYIRAAYTVNWVKNGTEESENPIVHATAPVAGTDYTVVFGTGWVFRADGYYYYSLPVDGGGETGVFIETLTKTKAAPEGYHLQVSILPEGVQTNQDTDAYLLYLSYWDSWGQYNRIPQTRPAMAAGGTATHEYTYKRDLSIEAMTFNIRTSGTKESETNYYADYGARDWYDRRDAVVSYLNNSGCDVICLQEVSTYQKEYIADRVSNIYNYQYTSYDDVDGQPYGLMTLYKKSVFSFMHYDDFYLSKTPEEWSTCFGTNEVRMASITLLSHNATKKVFSVVNAQFPYGTDDNETYQDNQGRLVRDDCRKLVTKRYRYYLFDFSIYGGSFNSDAIRKNVGNEDVRTHTETWYEYTFYQADYHDPMEWITTDLKNGNHAHKDDYLTGAGAQKTINNWAMENSGYRLGLKGPWMNQVKGPTDFLFVDDTVGTWSTDNGVGIYALTAEEGRTDKFPFSAKAEIDTNAKYTYEGNSEPLSCHWPVIADISYNYRVNQ